MMSPAINQYYAIIFHGWQFSSEVTAQQEFRKRLFVDELGWKLSHPDGFERDEFDTPSAIYCSLYLRNDIVGCWRAIQTSDRYLGKTIFPELADLRPYPESPDIWEISRLGVIRHPERVFSAQLTYALMFYFAQSRDAQSLVGVVSPFHNRNLVINGVKTCRYGTTRIIGEDARGRKITSFFGEIPMAEQTAACIDNLVEPIKSLELHDDALLQRRDRIPA